MGIVLYRVDERLIHGQVTVGWGHHLQPRRYLVVDDELPDSDWERELLQLGTPPGVEVEFFTVADARMEIPGWREAEEPSVLLTRDLDHMSRLAEGGTLSGEEVNLGGIHYRPGRTEVLSYLFLDAADRDRVRALGADGVTVSAQDLPRSPKAHAGRLLG